MAIYFGWRLGCKATGTIGTISFFITYFLNIFNNYPMQNILVPFNIPVPKGSPNQGRKGRKYKAHKPDVQAEFQSKSVGSLRQQPVNSRPVQQPKQAPSNYLSTEAIKSIIENCVRQEGPKTMPDHEFNKMVELIFNKIMRNTGSFEYGYQGYLSDSTTCYCLAVSLFNANKRGIWRNWS